MRFWEAVASVFRQYVGFRGRAPRSEFWYFQLFQNLVGIGLNGITGSFLPVLTGGAIWTLVTFLPSLAVSVRRLHDGGRTGWWLLMNPVFPNGFTSFLFVALFNLFQPGVTQFTYSDFVILRPPSLTHTGSTQIAYSDFITEVNAGRVRDVVIQGRTVFGQLNDGRTFYTYTPENPTLVKTLIDQNVRVIAKPEDRVGNPLLLYLFQPRVTRTNPTQIAYSDFITEVNAGRVRDVVIQGRTVFGQLNDGRTFQTNTPESLTVVTLEVPTLVKTLTDKNVRVITRPENSSVNPVAHLLLSLFPLPLIGGTIFLMVWWARPGTSGANRFGPDPLG